MRTEAPQPKEVSIRKRVNKMSSDLERDGRNECGKVFVFRFSFPLTPNDNITSESLSWISLLKKTFKDQVHCNMKMSSPAVRHLPTTQ